MLLLILVLLCGLTLSMHRDPGLRNVEIIPEMFHSIPYDGHDANPFFTDGKTLREPVPGTIPQGHMPLHYLAGESDSRRAGVELANPFKGMDEQELRRGEIIYSRLCVPCHGASGQGDGIVTRYGFPPPPSFLVDQARRLKDGEIFHAILYGKGNMPALASQVKRDDAWKAVLAVRSLQEKSPAGPAAVQASPVQGKTTP